MFHSASQVIEEIEENQPQDTAVIFSKDKCEQSPNLSLQNECLVKAKNGVQVCAIVNHSNNADKRRAESDIQHQIGNTFVPVLEAEAVKGPAKVFQSNQLLIKLPISYHYLEEKSIKEL